MKKLITGILLIVFLGSIGSIGYWLYQQKKAGLVANQSDQPANSFPLVGPEIASSSIGQSTESLGSTNNQSDLSESLNAQQLEIAGLKVLPFKKTSLTAFIEQKSGHLYVLDEQNNPQRLTNLTLPEIIKTHWGYDKNNWYIIFQQTDNNKPKSYLGKLPIPEVLGELLEIKTIPWLIDQNALAVSPDGRQLIYLNKKTNGSSVLYLNDWSLTKPTKLWSSPLADWSIDWPLAETVVIYSQPTYDYPGTAYLLNLKTKQLKEVISNILGLTAKLSPSGKKLIYSKSLLGGFSLYQYEIASGDSRLLDLKTLPAKCVWTKTDLLYCAVPKKIPVGLYPDDWQQGKVTFADDIWKIDLSKKTTEQIYQLKGAYDLTALTVNEETGWLYALDKKTGTLQTFSLLR